MSRDTTIPPHSPVAIWERVLIPPKEELSSEQARYFLRLKFAPRDVRRVHSLSAKARAGTLSAEEDEELENYLRIGDLLAILQSRARQALKRKGRAS